MFEMLVIWESEEILLEGIAFEESAVEEDPLWSLFR
jgi:hypothetical protein